MGSFQPFWLRLLVHSWCGIGFLFIMPTNTFLSLLVAVVQSLNHVWLFGNPCQASLSFTISRSLLKLMSIESVTLSNHLILCHPLLLLPSIFPNIRVFSSELALHIRWPKYWSFSFSTSPSQEYSGLITFMIDWLDLLLMGFLGLPKWLSGKESACQWQETQETWVWSLVWEDPLEEMATYSNVLAWEIPWIEEPDGLQSMGLQKKAGHDWVTKHQQCVFYHLDRKSVV